MPSSTATAAYDYSFEAAHSFEGTRACMVEMTRKWDLVKTARRRGWAADPEHPDVDVLQEAAQLHQLFESCSDLEESRAYPDDYRTWLEGGRAGAEALVLALTECRQPESGGEIWRTAADVAHLQVADSCTSCHRAYRN